jgi:hypothetical protein
MIYMIRTPDPPIELKDVDIYFGIIGMDDTIQRYE